jgi:hypothetical protein
VAIEWRIYYGNGATCDNRTPLKDVPRVDVQHIVTWARLRDSEREGRLTLSRAEYYIYKQGCWFPMPTLVDFVDHCLHEPFDLAVKGRGKHSDDYREIAERAAADADFPG